MNQTEKEDHDQKVRCADVEEFLEPIEILETLVDNTQGDDGIDEVGVRGHSGQGCAQQGDAVAQGECGDEPDHIPKTVEKEDHPEQKEQMVVPGDHVFSAEPDVVNDPTVNHGLVGGFIDAMGSRAGSGTEQGSAGQGGCGPWQSAASKEAPSGWQLEHGLDSPRSSRATVTLRRSPAESRSAAIARSRLGRGARGRVSRCGRRAANEIREPSPIATP